MKRSLLISTAVTKLSLFSAICVMGLSACQRNLYDSSVTDDGEVTVGNHFDFATTRSVQLKVNYGADFPQTYFEVYAENPLELKDGQLVKRGDLIALASGFTDKQGVYDKKDPITASASTLYIYSPDFGVPTLFITELIGESVQATISFDNAVDLSSLVNTRSANTRATATSIQRNIPNLLSTWDEKGTPDNIDPKLKVEVDAMLKSYITSSFPEKQKNDGSFVSDNADITIYKKAHVTINYFGGGTNAESVFAYYCYPKDATQAVIAKAAQNACVVFPNAHANALGDYSGVGVQLSYINAAGKIDGNEFPADTRIGFLIWNNGWNGRNTGTFADNTFYSTKLLNKDGISHTAIFSAENAKGQKYNIITMEDWKDADYNDLAFFIATDPINAIDVPPAPKPNDRKGTSTFRGLLGFEDNWPNKGDYDMNDVIVKYVSNVDYNHQNNVINVTDKFTLSWTGADYHNGFAYEVPFDLAKAEVTVSGGAHSSVSGNVITLFTDARSELGVTEIDAKEMSTQEVKEKVYTVSIRFKKPTESKTTVVPPYNPFIKANGSAMEVHLTNMKPSSTAGNTFPKGFDISEGNGTYFICKDGYPFAIHMDARIDATILDLNLKQEGANIDETYPRFSEWAKTRDPKTKWW